VGRSNGKTTIRGSGVEPIFPKITQLEFRIINNALNILLRVNVHRSDRFFTFLADKIITRFPMAKFWSFFLRSKPSPNGICPYGLCG